MEYILLLGLALSIGIIYLMYRKLAQLSVSQKEYEKGFVDIKDNIVSRLNELDTHFETRIDTIKEHVSQRVNENINYSRESTKEVNDRLNIASKIVGELKEKISAFEEGSKQIHDLGKSLSEIQNIFKAQKLRGGFGEELLEDLLAQILPKESFATQYMYKSGDKVDAIIRLSNFILPIDSKFPYENFKRLTEVTDPKAQDNIKRELARDLKKHVDNIASKYISKEDNSLDIAFMFIPAENIYYEVIIRDDPLLNVRQYAFDNKVVPVSPSTLYAYIQIVLIGMKGMQVSEKAREILSAIRTMESDFVEVVDSFEVVGNHINHARQKFEETDKRINKFSLRLKSAITIENDPVLDSKSTVSNEK